MTHICLLNTGFGQALRWGSKGFIEPKTSNIALRKATLMSNLVSRMPQCTLVGIIKLNLVIYPPSSSNSSFKGVVQCVGVTPRRFHTEISGSRAVSPSGSANILTSTVLTVAYDDREEPPEAKLGLARAHRRALLP